MNINHYMQEEPHSHHRHFIKWTKLKILVSCIDFVFNVHVVIINGDPSETCKCNSSSISTSTKPVERSTVRAPEIEFHTDLFAYLWYICAYLYLNMRRVLHWLHMAVFSPVLPKYSYAFHWFLRSRFPPGQRRWASQCPRPPSRDLPQEGRSGFHTAPRTHTSLVVNLG